MGTSLEELDKIDYDERKREFDKFNSKGGGPVSPGSYNPNETRNNLPVEQPDFQQQGPQQFNESNNQDQYNQQMQQLQQQLLQQQLQAQALAQSQSAQAAQTSAQAAALAQERQHLVESAKRERRKHSMSRLAKDISHDINNISPEARIQHSQIKNNQDLTQTNVKKENIKKERKKYLSYLPNILLDAFLILILYIILSQPQVIGFFGQYIKILNPDKDCNYPFFGILIYGLMLSVLYILCQSARPYLTSY